MPISLKNVMLLSLRKEIFMGRNILEIHIKIYSRYILWISIKDCSQIPCEEGKYKFTVKASVINCKCFYYTQLCWIWTGVWIHSHLISHKLEGEGRGKTTAFVKVHLHFSIVIFFLCLLTLAKKQMVAIQCHKTFHMASTWKYILQQVGNLCRKHWVHGHIWAGVGHDSATYTKTSFVNIQDNMS